MKNWWGPLIRHSTVPKVREEIAFVLLRTDLPLLVVTVLGFSFLVVAHPTKTPTIQSPDNFKKDGPSQID